MIRICRAQRPSLQHSGHDLRRLLSVLKQLETCPTEIETFSGELHADLVTICTGSVGVTAADGLAKATDPKSIGLPRTQPATCYRGTFCGTPSFLSMLSRRVTTATLVALEVPEHGARPHLLKVPLDPWSWPPGLSGNKLTSYGSVVLRSAFRRDDACTVGGGDSYVRPSLTGGLARPTVLCHPRVASGCRVRRHQLQRRVRR